MPHIHSKSSKSAIALLALVLTGGVLLAACGGSSSGSSSSTTKTSANASATTPATGSTSTTGAPGAPDGARGRFSALRECLKKNGVTLPARKAGRTPGAGGFPGGGASQLPAGVSRAQFEAAIKKCGGSDFSGRRFPGAGNRYSSPAAKQALAKFASCMRENGVNVPEPNTSGKGPVFSTKGLNTASAAFKAAEVKCRTDLAAAFRAHPGTAGAPGAPSSAG